MTRAQEYVRAAAKRHQVAARDILSADRSHSTVVARNEVMRRLRADNWTLKQIGRALGRHHSTVIHGLRAETPGLWFG